MQWRIYFLAEGAVARSSHRNRRRITCAFVLSSRSAREIGRTAQPRREKSPSVRCEMIVADHEADSDKFRSR